MKTSKHVFLLLSIFSLLNILNGS